MIAKMHLAVFQDREKFYAHRYFDDDINPCILQRALFVVSRDIDMADMDIWSDWHRQAQKIAEAKGIRNVANLDPCPSLKNLRS